MERKAKKVADKVAHDNDVTENDGELLTVAGQSPNSPLIYYFIELNKKLTTLRPGDTAYKTQPKSFIV